MVQIIPLTIYQIVINFNASLLTMATYAVKKCLAEAQRRQCWNVVTTTRRVRFSLYYINKKPHKSRGVTFNYINNS